VLDFAPHATHTRQLARQVRWVFGRVREMQVVRESGQALDRAIGGEGDVLVDRARRGVPGRRTASPSRPADG